MDKLEKVIKGLECCQKTMCPDDEECPYRRTTTSKGTCRHWLEKDAIELLKEKQPNIVRCKDCKYGYHVVMGETIYRVICTKPYIEHGNATHEPDWFCADGITKEIV